MATTVYANSDNLSATNIQRVRGDSDGDVFEVKDKDGAAQNIAGFSFVLTVNTEKDPTDNTNELYSLVGNITNEAGGVVEFAPSEVQADQTPGTYYYDVEMTDAGGKKSTKIKGKYKYIQDISK